MAKAGHLSASVDGAPIKVTATTTPGTLIHTATAATDALDRVFLQAYNAHTANVQITVEVGGATDPDNHLVMNIPFDDGLYDLFNDKTGILLQNAKTIRIFASIANVIIIYGTVLRGDSSECFN